MLAFDRSMKLFVAVLSREKGNWTELPIREPGIPPTLPGIFVKTSQTIDPFPMIGLFPGVVRFTSTPVTIPDDVVVKRTAYLVPPVRYGEK